MKIQPAPTSPEMQPSSLEVQAPELRQAEGLALTTADARESAVKQTSLLTVAMNTQLAPEREVHKVPRAASGPVVPPEPDRAVLLQLCGLAREIYAWTSEATREAYLQTLEQQGSTQVQAFAYSESFLSRLALGLSIVLPPLAVLVVFEFAFLGMIGFDLFAAILARPAWLSALAVVFGPVLAIIAVSVLEPITHRAVGFFREGKTYLVFQGTRPFAQLVLTDGAIFPWGWPLRHSGFLKAWRGLEPQVVRWLGSLPEDQRKLTLTGHSLGGALAFLAAFDLVDLAPMEAVVTFGAPRPGLWLYRHRYGQRPADIGNPVNSLEQVTWRYTHGFDLVSRVPPPLPYCHVGSESHILDSGRIVPGRPQYLIERIDSLYIRWLTWWNPGALALSAGIPCTSGVTPRPVFGRPGPDGLSRVERWESVPVANAPELARMQGVNGAIERLSWVTRVLPLMVAAIPLAAWTAIMAVAGLLLICRDVGYHTCDKYLQALGRSAEENRPDSAGGTCGRPPR